MRFRGEDLSIMGSKRIQADSQQKVEKGLGRRGVDRATTCWESSRRACQASSVRPGREDGEEAVSKSPLEVRGEGAGCWLGFSRESRPETARIWHEEEGGEKGCAFFCKHLLTASGFMPGSQCP